MDTGGVDSGELVVGAETTTDFHRLRSICVDKDDVYLARKVARIFMYAGTRDNIFLDRQLGFVGELDRVQCLITWR